MARQGGLVAIFLFVAAPAAGPLTAAAETDGTDGVTRGLAHGRQAGAYVQGGLGYRVLFPYDEEFCGDAGKSVCTGRSPAFLELGLQYALTDALELIGDVRLGLESDFSLAGDAPRALVLSPGVRFFVEDPGRVKLFMTAQAVVDLTDFAGAGIGLEEGADFGFRNVNGVLLDLQRHLGVHLFLGETIGFVRWLRFELDAGMGLQVRFP